MFGEEAEGPDLPAMSMAGEHECDTGLGCLRILQRRMGQENGCGLRPARKGPGNYIAVLS